MAHRIGIKKRELRVEVGDDGDEIVFYYRPPTLTETKKHDEKSYKVSGRGVKDKRTEQTLKTGMKLLTGIRQGDIEYPDPSDPSKFLPLDTNAMEPQEWKAIFLNCEPDMALQVCQMILGAGIKVVGGEEDEEKGFSIKEILGDGESEGEDEDSFLDNSQTSSTEGLRTVPVVNSGE